MGLLFHAAFKVGPEMLTWVIVGVVELVSANVGCVEEGAMSDL